VAVHIHGEFVEIGQDVFEVFGLDLGEVDVDL
jgi:hypothetical protein